MSTAAKSKDKVDVSSGDLAFLPMVLGPVAVGMHDSQDPRPFQVRTTLECSTRVQYATLEYLQYTTVLVGRIGG